MDFYLYRQNVYERLKREFLKHGKLIIACDFDDTIFDVHKQDRTYDDVINLLKRWQPYAHIIIWSGRSSETYPEIETRLKEIGLSVEGINVECRVSPFNRRKIFANAYLDDRAGLLEMYSILMDLIGEIEKGLITYVER